MHYKALILESQPPKKAQSAIEILEKAGRIIHWRDDISFVQNIDRLVKPDVQITPQTKDLRVRHVIKNGNDFYILFNEGENDIRFSLDLNDGKSGVLVDPYKHDVTLEWPSGKPMELSRHAIRILMTTKNT